MNKLTRTIATGLAAVGLALGGLVALQPAQEAQAAGYCTSGTRQVSPNKDNSQVFGIGMSPCSDLNAERTVISDSIRGWYQTSSGWVVGSKGWVYVPSNGTTNRPLIKDIRKGSLVKGQSLHYPQPVKFAW